MRTVREQRALGSRTLTLTAGGGTKLAMGAVHPIGTCCPPAASRRR